MISQPFKTALSPFETSIFTTGLKLGTYVLILAGIYYSGLSYLVNHDWPREDYNYAYLIPFVVLYLTWQHRCAIAETPPARSWLGLVALLPGIFLYLIGELGGEYYSLYISLFLVSVGLVWTHIGWKRLKVLFLPLLVSLSMFPLPNFLNTKVSFDLKLISSELGVKMMRACGMAAYREGNVIDLGFTQLQVVDACSGLRYVIPLLVLGLILSYFFRGALWKKIVLVLSVIPLAIISNSLRIAFTGILYKLGHAELAEGFLHSFSGWFIFMFSFGILMLEMWVLRKIGNEEKPHAEPAKSAEKNSMVIKLPSEAVFRAKRSSVARRRLLDPHFLVAVLLLGSTLAFSKTIDFREKVPSARPFSEFPVTVGGWAGEREVMEQEIIRALDLNDYAIIDYRNPSGKMVNFYTAYYESQRKGESIHSPETCLPGGGWVFKDAGDRQVPLSDGNLYRLRLKAKIGKVMTVNRAFMEKAGQKQLAYYWFPARGRILTNAYQLKIYTFWDALTKHRTDGALVRLITPVYDTEEVGEADKRLTAFTQEIVPILDDFIPGKDVSHR